MKGRALTRLAWLLFCCANISAPPTLSSALQRPSPDSTVSLLDIGPTAATTIQASSSSTLYLSVPQSTVPSETVHTLKAEGESSSAAEPTTTVQPPSIQPATSFTGVATTNVMSTRDVDDSSTSGPDSTFVSTNTPLTTATNNGSSNRPTAATTIQASSSSTLYLSVPQSTVPSETVHTLKAEGESSSAAEPTTTVQPPSIQPATSFTGVATTNVMSTRDVDDSSTSGPDSTFVSTNTPLTTATNNGSRNRLLFCCANISAPPTLSSALQRPSPDSTVSLLDIGPTAATTIQASSSSTLYLSVPQSTVPSETVHTLKAEGESSSAAEPTTTVQPPSIQPATSFTGVATTNVMSTRDVDDSSTSGPDSTFVSTNTPLTTATNNGSSNSLLLSYATVPTFSTTSARSYIATSISSGLLPASTQTVTDTEGITSGTKNSSTSSSSPIIAAINTSQTNSTANPTQSTNNSSSMTTSTTQNYTTTINETSSPIPETTQSISTTIPSMTSGTTQINSTTDSTNMTTSTTQNYTTTINETSSPITETTQSISTTIPSMTSGTTQANSFTETTQNISTISPTIIRTTHPSMTSSIPHTNSPPETTQKITTTTRPTTTRTHQKTTLEQAKHKSEGLSSGSVASILIFVIAIIILVMVGLYYYKIRRRSYGPLLDNNNGTLGHFSNPMYDP